MLTIRIACEIYKGFFFNNLVNSLWKAEYTHIAKRGLNSAGNIAYTEDLVVTVGVRTAVIRNHTHLLARVYLLREVKDGNNN